MANKEITNEEELRAKLRKIRALFEGAKGDGERNAAGAAIERIQAKLSAASKTVPPTEIKFTLGDRWARKLFVALCRRYSLKPYRYARQRYTTVMLRVPRNFVHDILWPEYQELSVALNEYLYSATEKIISEEIHSDIAEAEEVVQLLN